MTLVNSRSQSTKGSRKMGPRKVAGSLLLAAALMLTSCAAPELTTHSHPIDAQIHMDGQPVGDAPATLEPNYYGTILIHAEAQRTEGDLSKPGESFYGAKVQKVDFSAPVTPWLFGIDLVGETLVRLFGTMDETVSLQLPLVQPGEADALETLTEESEAASIAR